jgi:hypothetical protein
MGVTERQRAWERRRKGCNGDGMIGYDKAVDSGVANSDDRAWLY